MSNDTHGKPKENKTIISFKNSFWLVVIIVGLFIGALNFIQSVGEGEGKEEGKEKTEMKTGTEPGAEKKEQKSEESIPAADTTPKDATKSAN